jgi:pimeloyl-ACP methyl ester carboxylesterase
MAYRNSSKDFKGDLKHLSWGLRLLRVMVQVINQFFPRLCLPLLSFIFTHPRRKKDINYARNLPDGAQRLDVFHKLTRLTGWTWGEAGPAVLLVHGWESHVGRMLPLVEPLLERGYRVFAFDAPGHGLSPSAAANVIDVGYAIQSILEQHGPFDSIIAHSFGAAATTIMLAREPQLAPRKLVLLSPMRDLQQQIDIFADIAHLSVACKTQFEAEIASRVGLPIKMCSTVEAVHSLNISGLVVHDRGDQLIPYSVGVSVAQNWRRAQLISTDHLGHQLALRNPKVIHQILDFLEPAPQREDLLRLIPTSGWLAYDTQLPIERYAG